MNKINFKNTIELVRKNYPSIDYLSNEKPFKAGDIVTRDGSDRHEIIIGQDGWDIIRVKCIKAPNVPWAKVGDEEDNLARRYILVERETTCTQHTN